MKPHVTSPVDPIFPMEIHFELLRVTATPKQREDAKTAKDMGEDGIGPLLFGG